MGIVQRRTVAHENAAPFPGTFLAPGCLKVRDPEEEIYVMWAGSFESPPIGKARDFKRDEATGVISFNIDFHDALHADLGEEEVKYSVYAVDLTEYHTSDTRIILEATIRAIYCLPLPGYPSQKLPAL